MLVTGHKSIVGNEGADVLAQGAITLSLGRSLPMVSEKAIRKRNPG